MIKNAKIKFENWGSNAKVEAIKFVYADNSELAKAVRYMSEKRKYCCNFRFRTFSSCSYNFC